MKHPKGNRKAKPVPEEKSQPVSPLRKNIDDNPNQQLRDLSPFRQLYGSFHFPNSNYIPQSSLSMIQTPIQKTPFKPLLDQVDEGLRQISGLITWQKNSSSQEEGQSSYQSESDSPSSEQENENHNEKQENSQKEVEVRKNSEQQKKDQFDQEEHKANRENSKKQQIGKDENDQNKKRVFCNCKKTKCLKLYCDCFRDNLLCTEACNCVGCHNLSDYEDQRNNSMLSLIDRNPLAFIPKIDTQKQHSKGCHCKKSNCQKKYCECFQAGIRCGQNCKCQECKNKGEDECHHNFDNCKTTAKKEKKFQQWLQGN